MDKNKQNRIKEILDDADFINKIRKSEQISIFYQGISITSADDWNDLAIEADSASASD